ncbi:hypothetical protein [Sphingomonas desiccabilis]|nr:hypothetical protein [Sphingomonas desiccabilis]MBB3910870.1 hypothetical protein [Sphingomonas desiccabilis]
MDQPRHVLAALAAFAGHTGWYRGAGGRDAAREVGLEKQLRVVGGVSHG